MWIEQQLTSSTMFGGTLIFISTDEKIFEEATGQSHAKRAIL